MIEAVPDLQLYNIQEDPGESTNVAAQHPEVVQSLMKRIERAREHLGDVDRTGSGARLFDQGPRRLQVPLAPVAATPRYDNFEPLGDLRFTFETGTLEGWSIVEGQLGRAVSDAVSLPRWKQKPLNHEGRFHLSTLNTGAGASDKQTAMLQSPPFVIRGQQATFLVSGGFDRESLYVALCDAETGGVLLKAGGASGPQMQRIIWDIRPWTGRTVFLRVVDQNTGGWGHLTFDDFSVDGQLVESP
jgi:hypothetical protein